MRRLTLKQALAVAALIVEQEQWEALSAEGAPEEWAPAGYGAEVLPLPVPILFESDDEGGEEQEEAEQIFFSHFAKKTGDRITYARSFSSVRDFCEQPFYNKANEALWLKEEFQNGAGFREWGAGKSLRDHHYEALGTKDAVRLKNISWFGAEHAKEAADRAYHGWPEGADKVRRMMDNVDAPPPVSLRRKVQRADQGDELDVHSVYRGDLDHAWTRRRRLSSRSRMSVRVVALLGGSNRMDGQEMFWRGAAVAKLAEVLEESGYRVEIVGANQSYLDGHLVATHQNFVIKDAGVPLDLEQVAGVVCNPGFFRTWCFRSEHAVCEHAIAGGNGGDGLMSRSYVRSDDPVKEGSLDADGTKTFSVPVDVGSKEAATKWVNKCVAQLGGEEAADGSDD